MTMDSPQYPHGDELDILYCYTTILMICTVHEEFIYGTKQYIVILRYLINVMQGRYQKLHHSV